MADLLFLQKIAIFGKILGLLPWETEKSTSKIFSCIMFFVYTVLTLTIYYLAASDWRSKNYTVIALILENINHISLLAMMLYCCFKSVWYRQHWIDLFQKLAQIDALIFSFEKTCIISVGVSVQHHIMKLFIFHLIYFSQLLIILFFQHFYQSLPLNAEMFLMVIFLYQRYYITIILHHILTIIQRRCIFIENILRGVFLNISVDRRNIFDEKMRKFKELLFLYNVSIKPINKIFGLPILLLITACFSDILKCFDFGLSYMLKTLPATGQKYGLFLISIIGAHTITTIVSINIL